MCLDCAHEFAVFNSILFAADLRSAIPLVTRPGGAEITVTGGTLNVYATQDDSPDSWWTIVDTTTPNYVGSVWWGIYETEDTFRRVNISTRADALMHVKPAHGSIRNRPVDLLWMMQKVAALFTAAGKTLPPAILFDPPSLDWDQPLLVTYQGGNWPYSTGRRKYGKCVHHGDQFANALLPCPFCGCEELTLDGGVENRYFQLHCRRCHASSSQQEVAEAAVNAWNRRVGAAGCPFCGSELPMPRNWAGTRGYCARGYCACPECESVGPTGLEFANGVTATATELWRMRGGRLLIPGMPAPS